MTGTEVLSVAVTEVGRRPHPAADGPSTLRLARGCTPHAELLGLHPDLDPDPDPDFDPDPDLDLDFDFDGMVTEPDGPEVRRRPRQADRVSAILTVRGPGHPSRPTEAGR